MRTKGKQEKLRKQILEFAGEYAEAIFEQGQEFIVHEPTPLHPNQFWFISKSFNA